MAAQEKVERQPQAASGKRGTRLERFSLAVAASLLLLALGTGNTQATAADASAGSSGLLDTVGTQAQTMVNSGTRFVSDIRLLYQISQLREANLPEAQAAIVPQGDVKVCKAEPATLPPAKGKKVRL